MNNFIMVFCWKGNWFYF